MSLGLKLAMKASGIKAPKLSGPGKLVDTSNVQGTCQNFGTAVMALVVLLTIISMSTQSWIKGNAFGVDLKLGLKKVSVNGGSAIPISDIGNALPLNDTMRDFFTRSDNAGGAIIGTGILAIFPLVAGLVVSVLLLKGCLPRKSTKWQGILVGTWMWSVVMLFLGLILYASMRGKFSGSLSAGSSFSTWVVAAVFSPFGAFSALASVRVSHPDDSAEDDVERQKRAKAAAPSHVQKHNNTDF